MDTRSPLHVLIVTDVRLYAESLARALATRERLEVAGVATSAEEAMSKVGERGLDVLLLDPAMPAAERLVDTLHRDPRDVKIVVLGLSRVEVEAVRWATHGAHGFLTRENSLDQLVAIVESVSEGGFECSPRVASALLRALAKQAEGRGPRDRPAHLTGREYEVGRLLARGLSNKEIATSLGIAVSTTKNHVHNILTKLGLRRRAEVGGWMRRHAVPRRSEARRQVQD